MQSYTLVGVVLLLVMLLHVVVLGVSAIGLYLLISLEDGNIKIHWESNIWVGSRLPLLLRLGDGNIRTRWGVLVLGLAVGFTC